MADTTCCCPLQTLQTGSKVSSVPSSNSKGPSSRVVLNVGGERFTTARQTLTTGDAAGSLLADLVSGPCDEDGSYFLDQDASGFAEVLRFLRNGSENFSVPEGPVERRSLLDQASYLRLSALQEHIEKAEGVMVISKANGSRPTSGFEHVGAPLPANEERRVAKLRSLNALDTQNTGTAFDNITQICAAILDVPICLVSLVDQDRQWFKSKCGLDADQTPRSQSFCAFTLLPEELDAATMLVVNDAKGDIRFAKNPLVTGPPSIRFYAGCPLVTSEGLRMGSLCAIDRIPKALMPDKAVILTNFAYLTVQVLERSHLQNQFPEVDFEPDEPINFRGGALRTSAMKQAVGTATVLIWARPRSMQWRIFYGNEVWTELTGVEVASPREFPGFANVVVPHDSSAAAGDMLWDHLRLSMQDAQQVTELWSRVQLIIGDTTPKAEHVFAVNASVRRPGAQTRTPVSCRFIPADYPLDESAAVVSTAGVDTGGKSPKPDGWPDGLWMFVQVVPDGGEAGQEAANQLGKASQSSTQRRGENQQKSNQQKSASYPMGAQPKQKTGSPRSSPSEHPHVPFDDVQLLRLVGQGSFGSVYFSLWNGEAVAVKVTKTMPHETTDPNFEALLSASISHPHLVQTYKHRACKMPVGDEDNPDSFISLTCIVQEWCDGGVLGQHCKEPRLSGKGFTDGMEICLEIARAGTYLHSMNIIHGDLTANNVLLKSSTNKKGFVCKVCDFGLARILDGKSQEIITNTMGTVTHMPPELFKIQEQCRLTMKADVYALGMILHQVISGQAPFSGFSAPQIVVYISQGKRLMLPEAFDRKDISELYAKLTSTDPEARPTFQDVVNQLQELSPKVLMLDPWTTDITYRRCRTDPR